jgi:uncharacterized membrane-anchored protein
MTTKDYNDAEGWGIFIALCIVIAYLGANALFNHHAISAPLSNWIDLGPLLFIVNAGIFIGIHKIPGKELTDDEDKKKMQENYRMMVSSLLGFFTWLLVLVVLDMIPASMNDYVSIICGSAVILLVYYLLGIREKWLLRAKTQLPKGV